MHTSLLSGARGNARTLFRRLVLAAFNLCGADMEFLLQHRLRSKFLALIGIQSEINLRIGESTFILDGRNIKFGSDCVIGHFFKVFDWYPIEIGDRFFASNGLTMVSATHDSITYDSLPGPITIGSNVWIGINVTIVGPVRIGDNAVIGAGALVIRDVPDNAIVAGVPAKIIRLKQGAQPRGHCTEN